MRPYPSQNFHSGNSSPWNKVIATNVIQSNTTSAPTLSSVLNSSVASSFHPGEEVFVTQSSIHSRIFVTSPWESDALLNSTSTRATWCDDLQGSDFIYTPTIYSAPVRHLIAVFFIIIMIITVAGNAVVIIIVFTDRPLRRITSGLVVSMAAADILVALCGELQSVIMMMSQSSWAVSDVMCEIFTSTDLYFSLSELLHITCLAGDRYLAICYPFKYERIGRRYLVFSISVSWTLPLAFSFLPILVHWHRLGLEDLYECLSGLETHVCTLFPNKGFSTVSFLVMFAFPTALMCYCYVHIYRASKAQRKRMSSVTLGAYSDAEDPAVVSLTQPDSVQNGAHPHRPSVDVTKMPVLPEEHSANTSFIIDDCERDHAESCSSGDNIDDIDVEEGDQNGQGVCNVPEFSISSGVNGTVSQSNSSVSFQKENGANSRPTTPDVSQTKRVKLKNRKYRPAKKRSISGYKLSFLGEDFRAARSISIVFICYTVTWTPYWITILIMPYVGPQNVPDPVIGAGIWLAYFGSAVNPFVYYFSNTAVKKGIKRLLRKIWHRLGNRDHPIRNNSYT
ncbi:octopamine receptor beta-1R [Aplysia californica]|uniref:Octopamine receptor beta-1R n=1 Tax=Aplysia californica TaxID=6500 RepID=A0ABM0ZZT4_APLCA|nr:octopamine receptor beta-1R [Aplysia californica]